MVSRSWSRAAQAALFRHVVLPRSYTATGCDGDELFQAGQDRAQALASALRAKPRLAPMVRALSVLVSQECIDHIQLVLSACVNVSSLHVAFAYGKASCFDSPVLPNVRRLAIQCFDSWTGGLDDIMQHFPQLEALHLRSHINLPLEGSEPRTNGKRLHLRELTVMVAPRDWLSKMVMLCEPPAIRILRVGNVRDNAALSFAESVLELHLMHVPLAQLNSLVAFKALRRLELRRLTKLPDCLPPNLEHFELDSHDLLRSETPERWARLLKTAPHLKTVSAYTHCQELEPPTVQDDAGCLSRLSELLGKGINIEISHEQVMFFKPICWADDLLGRIGGEREILRILIHSNSTRAWTHAFWTCLAVCLVSKELRLLGD